MNCFANRTHIEIIGCMQPSAVCLVCMASVNFDLQGLSAEQLCRGHSGRLDMQTQYVDFGAGKLSLAGRHGTLWMGHG